MEEEGEGEQEEEEEEPLEDLKITDIDLVFNEQTQSKPFVGGFILLNFPESQEQIDKFRGEGLDIDSVIFLSDPDDENTAETLLNRNTIEREDSDRVYDPEMAA